MKYGAKSKLRKKCERFLQFSYLLDFLAIEALSQIYLNSVRDVVEKLSKLNSQEVDFKFEEDDDGLGGENTSRKRGMVQGPDPLFDLDGILIAGEEIPDSHFYEGEVP